MRARQKSGYALPLYLYIFLLIFAPLSFATSEQWSLLAVELLTGVSLLLVLWSCKKEKRRFSAVPGIIPLLLLLLWITLQIVPLPPGFVRYISPGAFESYAPLLEVTGYDRWISLSVNQKSTLHELLRMCCYLLFYFLTVQLCTDGKRLQITVKTVAMLSGGIAFLAIIQKYTSPDHIYWFRGVPENVEPMGPWVNRNQFAGFMAMTLPFSMALFHYYKPNLKKHYTLREKIVETFTSPSFHYCLLAAFCSIVILLSIFLALSRGGILVTIFTLLVFFLVLVWKKRGVSGWFVLFLFLIGSGLLYLNFGFEDVISRIDQSFTLEGKLNFDRLHAWRDTIDAIKIFGVTGSGFGTFVDIYPMFKTTPGGGVLQHAHNDYLELISEGGVVSLILVICFVSSLFSRCFSMLHSRRDSFSVLMGAGSFAGIVSMLLYSITDFNMHNGADGLYFFFLCGVFVSSSHTRHQLRRSSTLLPAMKSPLHKTVVALSLLFVLLVFLFPGGSVLARHWYKEIENVYINPQLSQRLQTQLRQTGQKSSSFDPLEGVYPMALGNIEKFFGNQEEANKHYLTAAFRNPLRGQFLQAVALTLPREKIQNASALMEASYKRGINKDYLMILFAEWLLWQGDRERAKTLLHDAFEGNHNNLLDKTMLLIDNKFSMKEIEKILPPRVEEWVQLASFYQKDGKIEESIHLRERAFDFIHNEQEVKSEWYSQLYRLYQKQDREEDAVALLRKAIEALPEKPFFHIALGDYYKKQGINYRAKEEYEEVLIFDPANKAAQRRLSRLKSR